jgi:hypothetical protein
VQAAGVAAAAAPVTAPASVAEVASSAVVAAPARVAVAPTPAPPFNSSENRRALNGGEGAGKSVSAGAVAAPADSSVVLLDPDNSMYIIDLDTVHVDSVT